MQVLRQFEYYEVDLLRFIGDAKVVAVFEDDWKVYKVFKEENEENKEVSN